MAEPAIFPIIFLVVTTFIALGIAYTVLKWRAVPGKTYVVLLMLAVAWFALTNAAELASPTPAVNLLWTQISYIGLVGLAPLWFLYTMSYTGLIHRLKPWWQWVVWIVPGLTVGLAFTNPWHRLIWTRITPIQSGAFGQVIYTHGWFGWLHIVYAYGLMALGVIILLQFRRRTTNVSPEHILLLIFSALFPWLGNALYLFHLLPWPWLDLTPFGFMISGLLIVGGMVSTHEFELAPVVHDTLFNNLSNGVLVLDRENRLLDLNPAARAWTGLDDQALGHDIFASLKLEEHLSPINDANQVHTQVELGEGSDGRVLDLTISPLLDPGGALQGRVVVLHDITRERELLSQEQRRSQAMESLNAISQEALSATDLPSLLPPMACRLKSLFDARAVYLALWNESQPDLSLVAYSDAEDGNGSSVTARFPLIQPLIETCLSTGQVNTVPEAPCLSSPLSACAYLLLPLILVEKRLGAVLVVFESPHTFTPEDMSLGELAARQVALAIAKTRLSGVEGQRSDQLAAIQSVSQMIASSLDLEQIFTTIASLLHSVFGYQYISIYQLEADSLHLGAQVGMSTDVDLSDLPITRGIIGRCVRTRKPQFVADVSADDDYMRVIEAVTSEICVPLLKDQDVLGTLNIEADRQHPLYPQDVGLLITIANQVVVAIENASLFEAEKEQRRLAEALRMTGLALSQSLNMDDVLDRLLDQIGNVVPYDSGCILLLDANTATASLARQRGYLPLQEEPLSPTSHSYPISAFPYLQEMIRRHQPALVKDTRNDARWAPPVPSARVGSWMAVPVITRGEVIGFTCLDKEQPGFYTPEHLDRLTMFTDQAAIALDNARLFTEIERKAEKERLLYAAARDFNAGLDTEAVLNAIETTMQNALYVDGGTIFEWDNDNQILSPLLDFTREAFADNFKPGEPLGLMHLPAYQRAIFNRQPAILRRQLSATAEELAQLDSFNTDELLLIPLPVSRLEVSFGLIRLYRKNGSPSFTDSDLELAQSFAAQAATALENARLHTEVKNLAVLDGLTGLANRRAFDQALQQEVLRAERYSAPLALLIVDIDSFKLYNDTYGHPAGDERLKAIAQTLQKWTRTIDIAARYGGEEFAVILPNTSLEAARSIADRVRAAAEVEYLHESSHKPELAVMVMESPDQHPLYAGYTLSIGVASFPQDSQTANGLLLAADRAELAAKRLGKNRVCTYPESH